jgi:hypothetical protein
VHLRAVLQALLKRVFVDPVEAAGGEDHFGVVQTLEFEGDGVAVDAALQSQLRRSAGSIAHQFSDAPRSPD